VRSCGIAIVVGFSLSDRDLFAVVEHHLRPACRVIVDVRKDSGGLEALGLEPVTVLSSTVKADRVCHEQPG
jgi:hypothetical protein